MEQTSMLEMLALGGIALLVVIFYSPGIKAAIERSKEAPKDWVGALIPLTIVVLFVLLLMSIV